MAHGEFAQVHGTRLRFEQAGASGPPVLIHGHTLDLRIWGEQYELFSGDFRVIRYDMRDYGHSSLQQESASHLRMM